MKTMKIIGAVILLLLITVNVHALGITPGRTTINYEDGLEKEIKFAVLNKEGKQMEVSFSLEGELKDYITLFESSVEFGSKEYSKEFKYKINLPEELKNEPGLHTAEIVALEVPKTGGGGTHIGATVAVVSQLYVYVACPGKCIDADFEVSEIKLDGGFDFVVPVVNRGEKKINEASAIIKISSLSGEKINEVKTNTLDIESGARIELLASLDVLSSGEYLAEVDVSYDGESKTFKKQFSVGDQILNIERVWVNEFSLGGIAKFRILIENRWNQDLKDVFANLIIYGDKNSEIANVKSASENIPSLEQKELLAYWDTMGVKEGEYNGKLIIDSEEKEVDKNLVLSVNQNSLEVSGVGYVISGLSGSGLSLTTILLIVIVILIIANILWFVFFRKYMKKRK